MNKEELIEQKWKVVINEFQQSFIIKEDTEVETPVASVMWPINRHPKGTQRQRMNAELIARAPELMKALRDIIKWACDNNDTGLTDEEYISNIPVLNNAVSILDGLLSKLDDIGGRNHYVEYIY